MANNTKKTLKIGIEAQPLMGYRTGVGNYLKGIVRGLETADNKNDYVLILFNFFLRKFQPPMSFRSANFGYKLIEVVPGRIFAKLLKYNMLPPLDLFLGRRIYFFANYARWPLLFSKSIVVIYDLSFLRHPEYSEEKNLRFMRRVVPKSVKKAEHIVVISKHTQKDVQSEYAIPNTKISVITPAIEHELYYPRRKAEVDAVREKYGLDKRYILFVGTLEPRKNIDNLIEAYSNLPSKLKNKYQLVIVGGKGWKDKKLKSTLKRHESENIKCTGYVPDGELPAIYSGADLFVFPSYFEGFGIPPLEAMACGVPVISARNSSLTEVIGEAGEYFDTDNVGQLSDKIQVILEDEQQRMDLKEKGLKRAQKFTWEKSAEQLVKVFEKVDKL